MIQKKILIVVDTFNWAIGKLSESIRRENDDIDIKIIAVHPRDASNIDELNRFRGVVLEYQPDLIHF
ncbi:MAG: hypothetical protein ABII98_01055, partial [bacterium]